MRFLLPTALVLLALLARPAASHEQFWDEDYDDYEDDDFDEEKERAVSNPLHNNKFIEDDHHAEEHVRPAYKYDPKTANPKEKAFHFFQSHDSDGDGRLDGLELYYSLTHGVHTQLDKLQSTQKLTPPVVASRRQLLYNRLMHTVDRIMKEDDTNMDGYLNYPEYAQARHADAELQAAANTVV